MLSTRRIDAAFNAAAAGAPRLTPRRSSGSSRSSAILPASRRHRRSQRRSIVVAASASPPPPPSSNSGGGGAGREFDVGRLWKEGGGVELTPEEAAVLREAAAKFSKSSSSSSRFADGGGSGLPPGLSATPPSLSPPRPASPPPPQHSALRDRAQFDRLHASSVSTPSAFFGNLASGFEWRNAPASSHSKQSLVVSSSGSGSTAPAPPPPWFVGGRLNVAINCLDRHVAAGRGAHPAFVWPRDCEARGSSASSSSVETLSYEDAASRVAELASWLSRSAGVGAGDSVAIMLPPGGARTNFGGRSSLPLLPLAFLAVARVGGAALLLDPSAPAEHNGAALASSGARVAITVSGGRLALGTGGGGAAVVVPIKERLDAAADACFEGHGHALETALCFEAEGVSVAETPWKCSRDVWSGAALGKGGEEDNNNASPPSPSPSPSSTSAVTAWPDANAPLLLAAAPGTGGSTLLAYPGAGLLVCSGAASRLALDASSEARVAVAVSSSSSSSDDNASVAAVVFGVLGPLANGATAVVLPPPRDGEGAGAWWALADKSKTTHVVADAASASLLARSASASGGSAPASVEVAMVVDSEPARPVVEALAAAVGEREVDEEGEEEGGGSTKKKKMVRRPVVAAWMPAGAGCPVLAAAPLAAEASKPGGMLPWLGCAPYLLGSGDGGDAEDETKKGSPPPSSSVGRPALAAAWPSMARSALGPDAQGWLRDSVLCGPRGEFSPPAALFEVNGEGEWYWAEAAP